MAPRLWMTPKRTEKMQSSDVIFRIVLFRDFRWKTPVASKPESWVATSRPAALRELGWFAFRRFPPLLVGWAGLRSVAPRRPVLLAVQDGFKEDLESVSLPISE